MYCKGSVTLGTGCMVCVRCHTYIRERFTQSTEYRFVDRDGVKWYLANGTGCPPSLSMREKIIVWWSDQDHQREAIAPYSWNWDISERGSKIIAYRIVEE